MFDFDIEKSDAYYFVRTGAREEDEHHNMQAKYSYLLYPLKDGDVEVTFHLVQKETTDENVAYSFSGDRDNVKGLVTTDTPIKLQPLHLMVKKLPQEATLVGDFSLEYKLGVKNVEAFEPVALQVTLKGKGYPPHAKEFLISHEGNVTLFRDKPKQNTFISKEFITTITHYSLALLSEADFTFSMEPIKVFNPKTQMSYSLKIPHQKIVVKKMSKQNLLDTQDIPAPQKSFLDGVSEFSSIVFGYVVVFISGFIGGYFYKEKYQKDLQKTPSLQQQIKSAKTAKELLQILLLNQNERCKAVVAEVEQVVYRQKSLSLSKLKMKVLECIEKVEG